MRKATDQGSTFFMMSASMTPVATAAIASDCGLNNADSQRFHRSVGFEEANRIVAYVKKL